MQGQTIRVFWKNARTQWFNYNWDGVITRESVVHISACQCTFPDGEVLDPVNQVTRDRGNTTITVKNIRPHGPNRGDTITGGVEFFLQIDQRDPIDLATDITVFDPPSQKEMVP